MRLVWIGVLAIAAAGGAPAAAWAGHPQEREGFYAGLALGAGGERRACEQCGWTERDWGLAGDLRAGWAVGRHVLVGPELGFSRTEEFDLTQSVYDVLLTATVYPRAASGLYVKAGGGAAFIRYGPDADVLSEDGLAFMAGAGWDVRVGRNVSITPGLTYRRTSSMEIFAGDVVTLNNFRFDVLAFSLGITLH